jgi:hypothetical protein
MDPKKITDIVNRSGFPLQIGIAHLIEHTTKDHGWRVLYTEHEWSNLFSSKPERDKEGFIDIVLENEYRTVVAVIECKRVKDVVDWIFLQPGEELKDEGNTKVLLVAPNQRYPNGTPYCYHEWIDIPDLRPLSPQAAFCVMPGHDHMARPLLERIASELIPATEALAEEERRFAFHDVSQPFRMYLNIIVTTAKLGVCTFNPLTISLADGTLEPISYAIIPYVRFRKQLSRNNQILLATPERAASGISFDKQLVNLKEHTVFVVNAEKLIEFLANFKLTDCSLRSVPGYRR